MSGSCLICGARRIWVKRLDGGEMPVQVDEHKQAPEINAMIEDEKIAREQESKQVLEVPVKIRRRKK